MKQVGLRKTNIAHLLSYVEARSKGKKRYINMNGGLLVGEPVGHGWGKKRARGRI
jgi:hypothetical protein